MIKEVIMKNIIEVQILFKDIGDYKTVTQTEFEFYNKHAPALAEGPPASTV